MVRHRGKKARKIEAVGEDSGVAELNETAANQEVEIHGDDVDVVTIDDQISNPCELANLEIGEAAARVIKQANTWATGVEVPLGPTASTAAVDNSTETGSSSGSIVQRLSLIGDKEEHLRSAPGRVGDDELDKELEAGKELAQRGYASKILDLLKQKCEQEEAAKTATQLGCSDNRPIITTQYRPEPIGTPRVPPIPLGVPLHTFRSQQKVPATMTNQGVNNSSAGDYNFNNPVDRQPLDLSFKKLGTSLTSTAGMYANTNLVNIYDKLVSTYDIDRPNRSHDSAMNPSPVKEFIEEPNRRGVIDELQIWMDQGSRSLFTSTIIEERRCVGPALGVRVGKILVNPWVSPQNDDQRKLLADILAGELKVGLLKSRDGRIIMRRKGLVMLQSDRLGCRCGGCVLRFPEKYDAWLGWIGHEIHQVGILDEFQKGFIMICPDCGLNPASPTVLDNCTDAILTCIRHWDDVNKGVIMEAVPLRVDCLCNRMFAKKMQNQEATSTTKRGIL
ncbi:hypothetical protein QAD02_021432 [Eretmocerus hayati]|uniref:Uncharacterized protein n=1 Tax=Eretmocerus hayati TaxID=131215 RepID=A0ACC2PSS0_9HYME|nr:hypothetical protein QAD02_021432 [Eretmocerus hayati]